mmetsp:Transcript_23369/g.46913  ORF Transcript_23369/g.46913 Transcript_23369/m.46913 type:complete len:161 (-) Transcript_23369:178-660(-)|eukprot:CAMPEP_0196726814 /NCGR_PEP_ID=MMETSP1091-20130531/7967_1 /TAXON_ID=302021 /ORGANISM="Rhodomonas sp., Strain CCMP768" /LENGTH=160 /DNA_ID=CAMNT_0042069301 /DNA_START=121 /DNA_END=603 /DNA_ORIENTATION=-
MSTDKKTKEESLERKAFRSKGLKEGEDDVRVYLMEPYNVRGKDRLLCFVSEHTLYPMTVVFNEKKWSLEKRFSEFAELDSQLDEAFKSDDDIVLPEFPPKKFFGSLSPALIKERREKLEKYMKSLVSDKEVFKCLPLREFLETPDIVGNDKHKEYDFGRR